MNEFDQTVQIETGSGLCAESIEIIQVNVGLKCNQTCVHCHVASSPKRTEAMDWPTMEMVIKAARKVRCSTVDITGGAPELNPRFRKFVTTLRSENFDVQVRTNLTVMLENGYQDLPDFYRGNQIRLVASLPCYLEENVRKQRGAGVYEKSVEVIKRLNKKGYGVEPDLPLNLVYNPIGPVLPPEQASLENDYRRELSAKFGIAFTSLLTIANMPIGRFLADLCVSQKEEDYRGLLRNSFNPSTVERLMCRHQINVDWDGTIFDCDFNLALKMPVDHGAPNHIRDFDPDRLNRRKIVTGDHCFGCTAGCGSSCGGALA
jgi:radical SAM/Cys-rich protein